MPVGCPIASILEDMQADIPPAWRNGLPHGFQVSADSATAPPPMPPAYGVEPHLRYTIIIARSLPLGGQEVGLVFT